jgi:ABC-2 type transport system ATP-binding protein
MDEAEYCRRVGLMVDGELVALDTPSALKRTWVPGRLLAVRGTGLRREALARMRGVADVEPFGAGLHVRGEADALDPSGVAQVLEEAGAAKVSVEEIPPTLEDVFLAVARRGASRSAAGATP